MRASYLLVNIFASSPRQSERRDFLLRVELEKIAIKPVIMLDEVYSVVMRIGARYTFRTPPLRYQDDPAFMELYSSLNEFMTTKRKLMESKSRDPDTDVEVSVVRVEQGKDTFEVRRIQDMISDFLMYSNLFSS